MKVKLCILLFLIIQPSFAEVYDLQLLCRMKKSDVSTVIQIEKSDCSLRLSCDKNLDSSVSILISCKNGKEFFNFGNTLADFKSYAISLSVQSSGSIQITTLDKSMSGKELQGRVLKGTIGSSDLTALKTSPNIIFKFEQVKNSENLNTLNWRSCTEGSIDYMFKDYCFKK